MKYAVEIGSGTMIYIPSFIKIGSGIQNLIVVGGFTDTQIQTQREWRSHKPTLIFYPIFLFWKNRVGVWDHVAVRVCVCVSPLSLLGNASVKVPLPLLGNGSVKIPTTYLVYYEITLLSLSGCVYPHICFVFYAVRVVSKESKRLVLPSTSCSI
jgi:hypothetical protein